jgi:RNA polymerase sigma-70 factor, ECF subfamily
METLPTAGSLPRPVRRGSADEADEAVMQRIAAADKSAMHVLFSRHHLAVYRFVLQRLRDKALAEDVTGEVFLDIWRNASRFQGQSAVLAWVLAVARHKTLSARPMKPGRGPGGAVAAVESADDLDAPLQVQDRNTVLRKCLTRLPVEHREVIDLVYYQEQSMESVATILGIPRNTAQTRVFHARKRLADELKRSGADWIVV